MKELNNNIEESYYSFQVRNKYYGRHYKTN